MDKRGPLLAVFAHPDDESFAAGGTLACYAAQGVPVYLVCATRGEVGEISDPILATPETLGQVREGELRDACRVLGVHAPLFLGYRDSGMAGTADNNHVSSLNQAKPEDVTTRLLELLQQLQPQVVVTFDPNGGYGHPDHVAVHRHTTAAFLAFNRGKALSRLYYSTIPRSLIRVLVSQAPEDSPFRRLDPNTMGSPDESITTVTDVSRYVEVKLRSIACHRTQIQQGGPFSELPPDEVARFLGTEHFIRAIPPFEVNAPEQDLFP
ncbi:MAG: PIG-L family deacetylase [Chloroflexi bacterium]|nr:PIG-L family deacetylase [Chloroflexota bacterium]